MASRKLLSLFALMIMLVLAGCYRDAQDDFESIDSQSSGEQTIPQAITDMPEETDIPVIVIDPNAVETEEAAVETEETVETEESSIETEEVVKTEEIVETEEASATLRVINPTATQAASLNTIPTATQAQFITPEVNIEAIIPTATATVFVEQPTLEPTPTTLGDTPVELGECDYVVQSGDTLFRIALNNDVSLAALLQANNLSEASIIQPEQVLIIPNCTQEEEAEVVETEEVEELGECDYVVQSGDTLFQIALNNGLSLAALLEANDLTEASIIQPNQVLSLPDCEDEDADAEEEAVAPTATTSSETIHTVASGDTLLSIARRYGVTVNEIIQANNIPNPNNLTVGQQLVIPSGE